MGDKDKSPTPPPKPGLNGPRRVQESVDPIKLIIKNIPKKKNS